MPKKKKKNRKGGDHTQSIAPHGPWLDEDGFHMIAPGAQPSEEQLEQMTKVYQNQIRNSPMWDEMVKKFGKDKAEELLKQCRAELR